MNAKMMLISIVENGVDTFQLIPLTQDSPYMEAVYNRQKERLTLIHPLSYETMQLIPKINDDGNFTSSKTHQSGYKHERLRLQKHFSFDLSAKEEIQNLVEYLTGKEQDLSKYFEPLPEVKAPVPTDVQDNPDEDKVKHSGSTPSEQNAVRAKILSNMSSILEGTGVSPEAIINGSVKTDE